jgi:hypothetical protein
MPRPNRETKADKAIAMLEQGMKPPEIAAALGCSSAYVRICRRRWQFTQDGKQRVRDTVYQNCWRKRREFRKAETPEQREARLKRIAAKAHAKRRHRKEVLERPRAQALRASRAASRLHAERVRQQKEMDLMIGSSISARREHVNRILAAWKGERA